MTEYIKQTTFSCNTGINLKFALRTSIYTGITLKEQCLDGIVYGFYRLHCATRFLCVTLIERIGK